MFGWQLLEALRREPSAARALVGVYTRDEHWPLPAQFPAAYSINTACGGAAGEHWVAVFLEDSRHAEYFDSYSTASLESIYQRLQGMATRTYGTVRKCYKGNSWGPVDSTFSTSWPCAAGVCPWEPLLAHSGNTTSPTMRPRSDAFWDDIHTISTQE